MKQKIQLLFSPAIIFLLIYVISFTSSYITKSYFIFMLFVYIFLTIFIHELGHYILARIKKGILIKMIVGPFQFSRDAYISSNKEWAYVGGLTIIYFLNDEKKMYLWYYIGGPLFNFIFFLFFYNSNFMYGYVLAYLNLFYCIITLIPNFRKGVGTDGYVIHKLAKNDGKFTLLLKIKNSFNVPINYNNNKYLYEESKKIIDHELHFEEKFTIYLFQFYCLYIYGWKLTIDFSEEEIQSSNILTNMLEANMLTNHYLKEYPYQKEINSQKILLNKLSYLTKLRVSLIIKKTYENECEARNFLKRYPNNTVYNDNLMNYGEYLIIEEIISHSQKPGGFYG
ncbi:site-2 protease family protein [Staphylococcus simulans]|uniref:Peptidase M50 domain-containing protein n=5 Tax=Staphylococcus TaxID=1279 RepID=A0ABN0PAI1_STASI|nr:site-2 protease family protein [Staphylococcus simulans]ERS92464.1 hypothetical protein SSIM_12055 [Staphylococcus simulans UMC-CNS-990]